MKREQKNVRFPIFRERFLQLKGDKTTVEFAQNLGMSRATVGFYEAGERIPDALGVEKICRVCGVSADWLLGLSAAKTMNITTQAICQETGLSEQAVQNVSLYQKQFYQRKVKEFKDDSRNMIIAQNNFLSSKQYDRFMCDFKNFLQTQTEIILKRKYANQNFDYERIEAYKRLEGRFTCEEEEEIQAQWEFLQGINRLQESKDFRMYLLIESFKEIVQKIVQETTDKIEES